MPIRYKCFWLGAVVGIVCSWIQTLIDPFDIASYSLLFVINGFILYLGGRAIYTFKDSIYENDGTDTEE